MLIEHDKRSKDYAVALTYSDARFHVPANVHILGMMNTADRVARPGRLRAAPAVRLRDAGAGLRDGLRPQRVRGVPHDKERGPRSGPPHVRADGQAQRDDSRRPRTRPRLSGRPQLLRPPGSRRALRRLVQAHRGQPDRPPPPRILVRFAGRCREGNSSRTFGTAKPRGRPGRGTKASCSTRRWAPNRGRPRSASRDFASRTGPSTSIRTGG